MDNREAPFLFPGLSTMAKSTLIAWVGPIAFMLVHAAAYLARMVTESAKDEDAEPIPDSDHLAS
jgi:hypothetical protein